MKFVSDLRQASGFLRHRPLINRHEIVELLLQMVNNGNNELLFM
jgi:hypothetical protein